MSLIRMTGREGIVKLIFFFCILSLYFISTLVHSAEQVWTVPVHVANAVEIEMAPTAWFPATVIGRDDSKLATEVNGLLENVLEVGDYIEKDEIIARIESKAFEFKVAEAKADIVSLEAKLDFYRREMKRLEILADKNIAAKNQLDEVSSNHEEYIGRLEAAKSRLGLAKDQLNRTRIKAPFAGVVTERYHTVGERVETGDLIIRLVNTQSLEVQVRVPEYTINFLSIGTELIVSDYESEIKTSIRALVPVGDDISRLYELRLSLPASNWTVGRAVRVAIPVSAKKRVIAVPRDALVIRQNDTRVFKINGSGSVDMVSVNTGIADEDLIEVVGNLRANDLVVTRGNERLHSGQKVDIVKDNKQ